MPTAPIGTPESSEYGPHFSRYVSLVRDSGIIKVLEEQMVSTRALLETISPDKAGYRYAEGKWTIEELVGHLADTERVFAYRALRFSRNDATALAGFDQDLFAANANYANLPLSAIIEEYEAVRQATLSLFRHMAGDAWARRGVANGKELSVRAAAFVIAGHELHHVTILKDRYL